MYTYIANFSHEHLLVGFYNKSPRVTAEYSGRYRQSFSVDGHDCYDFQLVSICRCLSPDRT